MWNETPEKKLETLKHAWNQEEIIANFLKDLKFVILHRGRSNELQQHGPRFYLSHEVCKQNLPVQDIEAFWPYQNRQLTPKGLPPHFFADIKEKDECSYYRKNKRYQSGIDQWCWEIYLKSERLTRIPHYVFHIIKPKSEKALDKQCVPTEHRPAPTGLFCHPILLPISDKYEGMVYWGIEDMRKIAELDDLYIGLKRDNSQE
jgi:hypothetical protein